MSYAPGHVPVGTRQSSVELQQTVVEFSSLHISTPANVSHNQKKPIAIMVPSTELHTVIVHREGDPARKVPEAARRDFRAKMRYTSPHTPVVVQAQHYADMRQIPGSGHGVNSRRHHHT
jgi:hypothetical protein